MSNQNADAINSGKSGGHNLQGQDFTVEVATVGSICPPEQYRQMGVSNGGK